MMSQNMISNLIKHCFEYWISTICDLYSNLCLRSSIGSISDIESQDNDAKSLNQSNFTRAFALNRPEMHIFAAGIIGAIANGSLFPVSVL
jgi:hypothetical protein